MKATAQYHHERGTHLEPGPARVARLPEPVRRMQIDGTTLFTSTLPDLRRRLVRKIDITSKE